MFGGLELLLQLRTFHSGADQKSHVFFDCSILSLVCTK
jgi:hypothetical protein